LIAGFRPWCGFSDENVENNGNAALKLQFLAINCKVYIGSVQFSNVVYALTVKAIFTK